MRRSYLYNGSPYTGKTASLYWDSAQDTSSYSINIVPQEYFIISKYKQYNHIDSHQYNFVIR